MHMYCLIRNRPSIYLSSKYTLEKTLILNIFQHVGNFIKPFFKRNIKLRSLLDLFFSKTGWPNNVFYFLSKQKILRLEFKDKLTDAYVELCTLCTQYESAQIFKLKQVLKMSFSFELLKRLLAIKEVMTHFTCYIYFIRHKQIRHHISCLICVEGV